MKSTHKVIRYDYSKFDSESFGSDPYYEYEYWGLHPKAGKIHVDTKRFRKKCKELGAEEFLPEGLFAPRNSVYFVPTKEHRYDYKVNIFTDLLKSLENDWSSEYKPIFELIRTPKQVEDENRLGNLAYTSCSDDYDEIDLDAKMAGLKRISKYNSVINSLYCQFISKISTEVDRFTLKVMTICGFKGKDFSFKSFCEFSDGLIKDPKSDMIRKLPKFNAYNLLRKVNNFLKHNSIAAYQDLRKFYPDNVRYSVDHPYENGMFAGDWIILKKGYIESLISKLFIFFKEYCRVFLKENVDEAYWNYDDFFRNVYEKLKNPSAYLGV